MMGYLDWLILLVARWSGIRCPDCDSKNLDIYRGIGNDEQWLCLDCGCAF